MLGFGEVAMGVLGGVERVIGASQGALEVAKDRIDGLELGQLDAGRSAAGDGSIDPGRPADAAVCGRRW